MDLTTFTNIVNGKSRSGTSSYHGTNPSTREKLWDVPIATREDLHDAVQAAQAAFRSWSVLKIEDRRRVCLQFGELYKSHLQEFDDLITKECGKPVGANRKQSRIHDCKGAFSLISIERPRRGTGWLQRIHASRCVFHHFQMSTTKSEQSVLIFLGKRLTMATG
jgi:hypothetical protein